MFDRWYTDNEFVFRKDTYPPAELLPESLHHYLESVDNEKVVYRFPGGSQFTPPDQHILNELRVKVEVQTLEDINTPYRVTFYYY